MDTVLQEIMDFQWEPLEQAVYTGFKSIIPDVFIKLGPTARHDVATRAREIFRWLVCSIAERGVLARLFNDGKLKVIYERTKGAPILPYRLGLSDPKRITLREVVNYPAERLIDGNRMVSLGLLDRLDLLFCENEGDGRKFLADLSERGRC